MTRTAGRPATTPGPGIAGLIAHRYPVLLVDRVVDLVAGERIVAVKAVSLNDPWYREAVDSSEPELAYPSTLLVESWLQAAALLGVVTAGQSAPTDRVLLAVLVADVEFHLPVLPGDVVEHDVRLAQAVRDSLVFRGGSRVGGTAVMTVGRAVVAIRPADAVRGAP